MTLSRLEPQRYFESVDADTERLIEVARRGLDAPVPCCPGWTVADVVTHVAQVYEHKVRVMADNAWPEPWPPAEQPRQEPLERLAQATSALFEEFASHQTTDETTTFSAADRTIAFWARRMALEVAVHRYDAELAHGEPTTIPDDLAVDGIDEVLRVMLAGPWWDRLVTTDHPIDADMAVESGGQRWVATAGATRVTVREDPDGSADVTVGGDPGEMFLWLWGRLPDDRVTIEGAAELAGELRARLAECTG